MRKLFSLFAALVFAFAANATIWNITPTHCFEGDRTDGYTLYVELARGAQAGDTIVLADGEYLEGQSLPVNNNIVVMAAEDAHPVVKMTGYFNLNASAKFEGIKFQYNAGDGYCMYFRQNAESHDSLVLENCEFEGFTNYAITSWEDFHVDAIIVNNCYFHNLAKGPFYLKASGREDLSNTCDKLQVTNCTFNDIDINGYVSVIDFRNNDGGSWVGNANELIVDHCTFYNIHGEYNRIIMSYKSANTTVSNCIIAQPEDNQFYPTYNYGGQVLNTLTFNTRSHRSGPTMTNNITGDPLFVDAANGNFTLGEGSPALTAAEDGGAIGDPRWVPAAAPALENGFYLVGSLNEWTPAAEYHLVGNPDNDAEYMVDVTLAENVEFKVVNVLNDEITAWFPGGDNYVVDANHAGEKTVYFRPDYQGGEDWFGACIYIAPNAEPQPVEMTAIYDWAGEIGTTIFGGNSNITTGTVKIHENTDDVSGIKFGSSYVYADGKYIAIKPAEGGFKAGDVLSVSVVFNNSDLTKYCMADVYAADQKTRLFRSDSASTLNGRNAGEPIVQTYTLAADQDSLFLGRYGSTGMFITLLKVERAESVTPEPTHTFTVAGDNTDVFGTSWDPTNTANDMVLQEDNTYKWEKTGLTLPMGQIAFKVVKDHDWNDGANAYPKDNYILNIAEAGIYTITITFNADTKEVNAVATKTGDAVVIPTVAMHGNFLGSWADTENFTVAEGDATASLTLNLAAGNYEFGMRIGGSGNWTANGATLTREANSTDVSVGSGNMKLIADVAGDYIFTYTFENNTLAVTFPIGTGITNTAVDAQIIKTIENGQLIIIKNGVKYDVHGTITR